MQKIKCIKIIFIILVNCPRSKLTILESSMLCAVKYKDFHLFQTIITAVLTVWCIWRFRCH